MNAPKLQTVDQAANPNPAEAIPDPFDLENLRLSQNFVETAGVKKLLRTVPVRKPNKQDYIRVHPNQQYRDNFPVIDLKDEREIYIPTARVVSALVGELVTVTLFTTVNRQGVTFLWPVRLPDPNGKSNQWWDSARDAAAIAMTRWVRVNSNMSLGAYDLHHAENQKSEPEWPEASFQELIKIAFRDRLIDSLDHPVIRRLRGET
jgi:hypothetical protein